ncbi:hypothetical protein SADUNF_Sadunf16G0261000 [Salix dunnii]|uniref:Yippee domain-containing protein n=1 Tax=Salix dunnii TaxID=1413687 RepID=A0A835JAW6_9ROSI|nr:hypothetical protein SADUNF_Sadunf16G0261000 [Salix dunnii]
MGRIFVVELEGRSYRCKFCGTHLAHPDELVSKCLRFGFSTLLGLIIFLFGQSFHSRRGKAYLFNNVVNITVGAPEERAMFSGLHIVADIFCCCCGGIIGWKYVISLSLANVHDA